MNESDIRDFLAQVHVNPQSFHAIYEHFYPRVFAYVAYRVGRAEDAEDIVSSIFMRVVSNLHKFDYRGEGSFSAWLFHIAYNEVNRFYERHRNRTEALGLDELPEMQSASLSVESMVQLKEQFEIVRGLIEGLSPRRQEIIRLKFYGELRNKEIAAILGINERSVASHLSRALDDLRSAYAGEMLKGLVDHA